MTSQSPGQLTMIEVSSVKLAAWALKQPDDRLVNFAHSALPTMSHPSGGENMLDKDDPEYCGCLMMQYLFEVLDPRLATDSATGPWDREIHCGHKAIAVVRKGQHTERYVFSHLLQMTLLNESHKSSFMSEITKLRTFGEVKPYMQRFIAKMSS